ncbi:phage major tail tube protein [Desulfocurvus sp.]|uniref:phage major tail tube protein n=1 Tax=Desulfocurvus sp. TaxID=2871698 RepID=UPI0025C0F7F8|nr:phage major tail tube protein [Desulfocurvus sp.]MCK9241606.1 phage major tail tube protein [Desulfocurvus sp.]
MAADNILRQWALFVDGRGYVGNVEQLKLPELTLKTEEFRAAGMDAPVSVDMGMEKLETTFTLTKKCADMLKLFGGREGGEVPLTARGGLESADGTVTPVIVSMRGRIVSVKPGEWKAGERPTDEYTVTLVYYKYEQGGEVLHEIDVLGMKRIVGGVDRLEEHRRACGI